MKVFAYCKASDTIGLGHLARVTSFLLFFIKDRHEATVYVEGTLPVSWAIQHPGISFRTSAFSSENQFVQTVKEGKPDLVVVDAYALAPDLVEVLQSFGSPVLHFNDFLQGQTAAAFTICTGSPNESDFILPAYSTVFSGHSFTPLRAPFLMPSANVSPAFDVVVNMGGADNHQLVFQILKWLDQQVSGWHVAALSGKPQEMNHNFLQVFTSVSAETLATIYRTSRKGILPVSVSAVEALACGLPVCLVQNADNQQLLRRSLENEKGIFFWFKMETHTDVLPFQALESWLFSERVEVPEKFESQMWRVFEAIERFLEALHGQNESAYPKAAAFAKRYIKSS